MPDKHVHIRKEKNRHIYKAIELANELLDISVDGTRKAEDDSSMIFFGIIRDYAFRIKKLADEVLKKKEQQGD